MAGAGQNRRSRRPVPAGTRGARWGVIGETLDRPMASWYLVLVSSVLLVGLGALMVLSASSVYSQYTTRNAYFIAERQLIFLALGLVAAFLLSRCRKSTLKLVGWASLIASVVMLLAVFVPGLGSDAGKGNLAWLRVGPFTVQPSEFAKFALCVWSATVVSNKEELLDRPRELAPVLAGFGVVEVLILAQKDLGTALIVAAIALAVLWVVGVPGRMLGAIVTLGGLAVLALVVTSPNRMTRIAAFLTGGSTQDPNESQQPLAAIYGLASGGWWGLGLGRSRQKWGALNDGAQNDYVFAVLGEELGLFGSLLVLALFAVLAYAGLRIALRSDNIFCRVASASVTAWMMFQALVNMGVAMKMLPVIGVPLPFISAGGSALVACMAGVGVLLACARMEPDARRAL